VTLSELAERTGYYKSTILRMCASLEKFGYLIPFGRVEDGRGCWGHVASLRFPSPLIELDVPISSIQLSDWLHRGAHDVAQRTCV
jgi:IclR helix-turn-helix domain